MSQATSDSEVSWYIQRLLVILLPLQQLETFRFKSNGRSIMYIAMTSTLYTVLCVAIIMVLLIVFIILVYCYCFK